MSVQTAHLRIYALTYTKPECCTSISWSHQ